jgi:DNA repair exonuclease SbcCD nuclease subunit
MKNKVAILGDTHFGARNDSFQFDEYFERFFRDVFFPTLEREGIKTIIHLGDVFDRRRYINFYIYQSCIRYFFEPMQKAGITMHVIPGNHDVYHKNTNDINSLSLLLRSFDNIIVHHSVETVKIGDTNFTFVPWITVDNIETVLPQVMNPKTLPATCIGHFEFCGFDMYRGSPNEDGLNADTAHFFDAVFTGHYHHRSSKGNVFYLGSPYEFTWADFEDPRGFHLFDTTTKELTFKENPYKMFHKIYYDDTKPLPDVKQFFRSCVKIVVVQKTKFDVYDQFIESLYNQEVAELTVHEDFSEYENIHRNDSTDEKVEDTLTLLLQFVESANTDDDKEALKTIIRTLFVEAQHLEE